MLFANFEDRGRSETQLGISRSFLGTVDYSSNPVVKCDHVAEIDGTTGKNAYNQLLYVACRTDIRTAFQTPLRRLFRLKAACLHIDVGRT